LSATRIERSFLIADFIRFGWVIAKDGTEIRLKPYKRIFFLSGAPVRVWLWSGMKPGGTKERAPSSLG